MASFRISCSCGGQWGMEGQGHTASSSAQPRFQISKPTITILTEMLAWMRCKVFKELRLASALRDAHPIMHAHLCMFSAMSSSNTGGNAVYDEGLFATA